MTPFRSVPLYFFIGFALSLSLSAQAAMPSSCVFDVYLSRGLRDTHGGSLVTRLQQFLSTKFNLSATDVVTGYFGPTTERLVMQYQKSLGLEATGALGPKTRAAVAKDCAAATGGVTSAPPTIASSTSSCSIIAVPECASGTLAYQGKDARGCSRGFECLPFRFPATSTPVVPLPNALTVAPSEFIATSSIIFTKFPTGSAGDRTQFVMGETSSVYLELNPAKKLCLRVLSALDGNKSICGSVELHTTYHIELFALAKSASLLLNDVKVISVSSRHDAPTSAFRAGSKAADSIGYNGPLIGSLQKVTLQGTSTVPVSQYTPQSVAEPAFCAARTPVRCAEGYHAYRDGTDSTGCAFYRCAPTAACPAIVYQIPQCGIGQRLEPIGADSGCPRPYQCVNN